MEIRETGDELGRGWIQGAMEECVSNGKSLDFVFTIIMRDFTIEEKLMDRYERLFNIILKYREKLQKK